MNMENLFWTKYIEYDFVYIIILYTNKHDIVGMRRGQGALTDLNRRITDLKMAGGTNITAEIRRDSNSTVSTYYGSMKSADLYSSRRSSQVSQVCGIIYT